MKAALRANERRLDRAHDAGLRWRDMQERRAEAVRLLKHGGPELADSPERVRRWRLREEAKRVACARAAVTEAFVRERRIGPTLDLDDFAPNDAAELAGKCVGRIVELSRHGGAVEGFATAFLITPSLLITNQHVFAEPSECAGCGVQFGYELQTDRRLGGGVLFALDPDAFFYASEELDFAIVGVAAAASNGQRLSEFSHLPLIPVNGKILVGHAISIIQHPDGGPKKYGVRDNELLIAPAETDRFLEYTTDTLPGSSGSPAFNKDWEVVALHHSGVPEIKDGRVMTTRGTPWSRGMPDGDIHWVANEGVRVSRICMHLASAQVRSSHQSTLAALVRSFADDLSEMPAIRGQRDATATTSAPDGPPLVAPRPPLVEKKLRFDPDYDGRPARLRRRLPWADPCRCLESGTHGALL